MKDRKKQGTFLESTARHSGVVCRLMVTRLRDHRQAALWDTENTDSTIKTFLLLAHTYIKAFFVHASKPRELFHFLAAES